MAGKDLYPIDVDNEELAGLIKKSTELRKTILRMITGARSGHPGGSLSCVDIIVCLFYRIMNGGDNSREVMRKSPAERDAFFLSKGHAAPALYAVLSDLGFIETGLMETLRTYGSPLQGHPKKGTIPGIDISTGSLGIGASIAVGNALAQKLEGSDSYTYCLLGDGECDEGIVWEAAMSASHFRLDNLVYIIDRNGIQLDGPTEVIMGLEPLAAKWESFGWHVIEIDGTSVKEILMALSTAKELAGKPTVIIAYMIKGEGVSFMEHIKEFHGKPPKKEELGLALAQLDEFGKRQIDRIIGGRL